MGSGSSPDFGSVKITHHLFGGLFFFTYLCNLNIRHMKKIFLAICAIVVIVLVACGSPSSAPTPDKPFGDFRLRVIDNCEYLEFSDGLGETRVYSVTHKGNCKYCAQRNAK